MVKMKDEEYRIVDDDGNDGWPDPQMMPRGVRAKSIRKEPTPRQMTREEMIAENKQSAKMLEDMFGKVAPEEIERRKEVIIRYFHTALNASEDELDVEIIGGFETTDPDGTKNADMTSGMKNGRPFVRLSDRYAMMPPMLAVQGFVEPIGKLFQKMMLVRTTDIMAEWVSGSTVPADKKKSGKGKAKE